MESKDDDPLLPYFLEYAKSNLTTHQFDVLLESPHAAWKLFHDPDPTIRLFAMAACNLYWGMHKSTEFIDEIITLAESEANTTLRCAAIEVLRSRVRDNPPPRLGAVLANNVVNPTNSTAIRAVSYSALLAIFGERDALHKFIQLEIPIIIDGATNSESSEAYLDVVDWEFVNSFFKHDGARKNR